MKVNLIALKPCPFCGSDPAFINRDEDDLDGISWDIMCGNPACYLVDGADWWDSKEFVAQKWNKRTKGVLP